jgi:plastocyanin
MGADIESADEYSATEAAASASSINNDKGLKAATVIRIQDMAFSSATVTIDAGTAVRFINDDDTKHNATADDASWGTGTLTQGQSFSRYFDEEGTYTYHCTYHPSMVATIVVTD